MAKLILTIEIPSDNMEDVKAGFLARMPNKETIPDPENEGETLPKFTDKEWLEEVLREYIFDVYKRGKRKLARQTAIIDDDIFK